MGAVLLRDLFILQPLLIHDKHHNTFLTKIMLSLHQEPFLKPFLAFFLEVGPLDWSISNSWVKIFAISKSFVKILCLMLIIGQEPFLKPFCGLASC